MLKLGITNISIFAIKNSWLHNELTSFHLPSFIINSKEDLIDKICDFNYDYFVSCGCKYILPISTLMKKNPSSKYINIHPSYLPDLKGADPIPASILFSRDSGVTCHVMDDSIDGGPIISQHKIPYYCGLDSLTLYKLCFSLEPFVFEKAYNLDFEPTLFSKKEDLTNDLIYYSFKKGDNIFHQSISSGSNLVSTILAFNTPSKSFSFSISDSKIVFYVRFASLLQSESFEHLEIDNNEVRWSIVFCLDNDLILSNGNSFVRFFDVKPSPKHEYVGKLLTPPHLNNELDLK